MFVGNLTPLLIIAGACGISATSEDAGMVALQVSLLQNAMLIGGIVTLVQVFSIGPMGGELPIVMGTSSGFIGGLPECSYSHGRRRRCLWRNPRRFFDWRII